MSARVYGNRSSEMTYKITNSQSKFTIGFKTGVVSLKKSKFTLKEDFIRVEASYGPKEVRTFYLHLFSPTIAFVL